jgi:hypothetical protein
MNTKEIISQMLRDRAIVMALLALLAMLLVIVIISAIYIRPSDLQVPIRYSAYGITNFYRDKWYYEIFLALFALVVTGLHLAIGVRLYQLKGREMTLGFIWFTVGILAITAVLLLAIFRVASLSQ